MSRSSSPATALSPSVLARSPVVVDADRVLRTERLILRPLIEADRGAYLGLIRSNIEHLERWLPVHEPGEPDDAYFDRQLAACARGDADRSCCRRVAELVSGGGLVGCFHLNSITRGLGWEADAVWWVAREHGGRGLATEGLSALLAFAFDPLPSGLGLHSVHCGIAADSAGGNAASARVAEKCGFRLCPGRQSYLKVGQRWAMHDFYLATPPRGAA